MVPLECHLVFMHHVLLYYDSLHIKLVYSNLLFFVVVADDEEEDNMNRITTSRQTVIEVQVPSEAVGAVIGRQGATIKQVMLVQTHALESFKFLC